MIYHDTSVTSNTVPWDTKVVTSSNCVITGTVPTNTDIQQPNSYVVIHSTSDQAFLELPRKSPRTPRPPVPEWGNRLQKVRPFFAPRPEFHARSNPQRR